MDQNIRYVVLLTAAAAALYIVWPSSSSHRSHLPQSLTTGLLNTGNDCYANSTFQALASLNSLVKWLEEATGSASPQGEMRENIGASEIRDDEALKTQYNIWIQAVLHGVQRIRPRRRSPLVISLWPILRQLEAKLGLRLSRYQQDAHEFLILVLDQLEIESKRSSPVRGAPIHDPDDGGKYMDNSNKDPALMSTAKSFPFAIEFKNSVRCLNCNAVSETRGSELILERQLHDPILNTAPEIVFDFRCENCGPTTIQKSISIDRYPPILLVHLQRSSYYQGQMYRRDDRVELQLQMNSYKLKAVIFHKGVHTGGHYTCARRQPEAGRWWLISDDTITEWSDQQVLSNGRQAYLLFYEQDDIKPSSVACMVSDKTTVKLGTMT